MIDHAESQGLVLRGPNPDDRRAQTITLTAAGEDALAIFIPHAVTVLEETVYSALDDDEVETLIDLLTRIAVAAHQLVDRD